MDLKILGSVGEVSHKIICTLWFHLYEKLEKAKQEWHQLDQWLTGAKVGERGLIAKDHEKTFWSGGYDCVHLKNLIK